jgi:hypothetical protein
MLVPYRHPRLGFQLPLPDNWQRIEDLRREVALVAVGPDRPVWFRTNVVVTVEQLPPGRDPSEWHDANAARLPGTLHDFTLIDAEHTRLGGWPARRMLAHHHAEPGAVTMEQWSAARNDTGYTLTASTATLEYHELAKLFATIAARFTVNDSRPDGTR